MRTPHLPFLMLPTMDLNLQAVAEIILLMSKKYQFVIFKV